MENVSENIIIGNRTFKLASKSIRFFAYLIDILIIYALPLIIFDLFPHRFDSTYIQQSRIIQLISIVLFLLKDIIGRSPGKIILKMRIVKRSNPTKTPNPFILVFRNIFHLFWILEPIVILLNPDNKRIADMITDSMVVSLLRPEKAQKNVDLIGDIADDLSDPAECISCGAQIPAKEFTCPKCGWSYKTKDAP